MIARLTTSSDVEKKIIELQRLMKLSTKASVIRIAIGISLKEVSDPRIEYPESQNDHDGATYQRTTITGDNDELYKALFIEQINEKIKDEEIFPELMNAHIGRGINKLYSDYKLKGNYEKLLDTLFELI